MESVRPALIPMAGRMLHDEEGRLRLIPYGNKPHEVIYSVSRGGLERDPARRPPSRRAGSPSASEETVSGVDFAGPRGALHGRGRFREPRTRPYDVLIGTDGSASAVRGSILERTGGQLDEEPLGHGYKGALDPGRPPVADSGWRRTPSTSGREASTC